VPPTTPRVQTGPSPLGATGATRRGEVRPVTQAPFDMTGLREVVHTADSIAVVTGAGISAESGVPTFRGTGESCWW
jgi:hypothetical protein